MTDQTPVISHEPVGILLTLENGKVVNTRMVEKGEVTASMETFLWMAKQEGYTVIPPAGGKDNDPDSDTNS